MNNFSTIGIVSIFFSPSEKVIIIKVIKEFRKTVLEYYLKEKKNLARIFNFAFFLARTININVLDVR